MNRPTPKLLTVLLAAAALFAAGCGEDDPPAAPEQVIESAFPDDAGAAATETATVEVVSLGFEDSVLESRTLAVDAGTYDEVKKAIGGTGSKSKGLFGLATKVETAGTEELDGTEVDHVTGDFDVKKLVNELESASQQVGAAAASLPGVGELDELRDKLVGASFDLYAQSETGEFQQLDLTLSIDDRENASPPTRIRFTLTESDPEQAPN